MDLTHQLANALQQAIINADRGFKPGTEVEHWQKLIQKVQDLDSAIYLPAKCKAAGCDLKTGKHVCDQDDVYDWIVNEAMLRMPRAWSVEQVKEVMRHAIARALGEVEISEERKVIYQRLSDILTAVQEAEIHPTMSPRYTMPDVRWLHWVATKCLSLYAKEQVKSWCMTHRKQMRYCEACGENIRLKALKDLASAVKKVCSPETVQALISAAHPEEEFIKFLREKGDGPTEVAF